MDTTVVELPLRTDATALLPVADFDEVGATRRAFRDTVHFKVFAIALEGIADTTRSGGARDWSERLDLVQVLDVAPGTAVESESPETTGSYAQAAVLAAPRPKQPPAPAGTSSEELS